MEDREREYHKARARIFGNGQAFDAGDDPQPANFAGAQRQSLTQGDGGPRNEQMGPLRNGHRSKKAVLRNRQDELRDPDFQRGISRRDLDIELA